MSYFLRKKKVRKKIEWRSREVSPKLNVHSLFEARSSMSESCAYRFEPLLVNLSERWDYLNEFEWSIRRVWVENIAVYYKPSMKFLLFCSKINLVSSGVKYFTSAI